MWFSPTFHWLHFGFLSLYYSLESLVQVNFSVHWPMKWGKSCSLKLWVDITSWSLVFSQLLEPHADLIQQVLFSFTNDFHQFNSYSWLVIRGRFFLNKNGIIASLNYKTLAFTHEFCCPRYLTLAMNSNILWA